LWNLLIFYFLVMSRIGKNPIIIPAGVEVVVNNNEILVKGPKGELSVEVKPFISVEVKDSLILVKVPDENSASQKAYWGLYRSLIANNVTGVSVGFEKKLELNGVGYSMTLQGNKMVFNLGFSHKIEFEAPTGIVLSVEKNVITIAGISKDLVGLTAAKIRKFKPIEPYKLKGIKYIDEVVVKKAGKMAKSST